MWRRNKPPFSARAWRMWGHDHPELAGMVARLTWVLDELVLAGRSGSLRRNSPEGVALVEELMQLGAAITQWTRQFDGDEARAWHEQLRREVDARLERIDAIDAERERRLQVAVERERERKLREAEALTDRAEDSAPGAVGEVPASTDAGARPALKEDLDDVYKGRRDLFLAEHKRYPSRDEDRAWGGKQKPKITNARIDELREAHLPGDVRKGGRRTS